MKWNNLTTHSEGKTEGKVRPNWNKVVALWLRFSARCKSKSHHSQTVTIGCLSKTLNPQLYAWIVSCLICVVLWIDTSAKGIHGNVNISWAPFQLHISIVAPSCYRPRAEIYSTVKHLRFNGFRELTQARGMRNRLLHVQNQQSGSHTATCLQQYSAERTITPIQNREKICSRKETAPKGKGREGRRKEEKRLAVQKWENRKGARAGAICWQWNVSHGEGERAQSRRNENRRVEEGGHRKLSLARMRRVCLIRFESN